MGASFTSTAYDRHNAQAAGLKRSLFQPIIFLHFNLKLKCSFLAIVDEATLRYARVKKKGYVRMITTHGPINLELHCEMVINSLIR